MAGLRKPACARIVGLGADPARTVFAPITPLTPDCPRLVEPTAPRGHLISARRRQAHPRRHVQPPECADPPGCCLDHFVQRAMPASHSSPPSISRNASSRRSIPFRSMKRPRSRKRVGSVVLRWCSTIAASWSMSARLRAPGDRDRPGGCRRLLRAQRDDRASARGH